MQRPHASRNRLKASPRARRALAQQGLSPAAITGSGPGGRIVAADVLRAAAAPATNSSTASDHTTSAMRRSIARVTSDAAATVPQFHLRAELDASALLAARQQLLESIQGQFGARLSITDLILRAMALALRDNPSANAIWKDGALQPLPECNVALVVSLEDGLLLPALRAVDAASLGELASKRTAAVAAARAGRIVAGQAATSLSNLGTTRVDDFTALIFPPQSTILSAGRIADRPCAVDGQLVVRPTLRLTLTVDHRVLDGAPAAQFLGRIVRYLEQPILLCQPVSSP